MSTPWEIDPTEPDRDGAGAEGGAMGGDAAGDSNLPPPLQPPEEIDRTNPFQPTGTSTPYPSDSVDEQIELANMALDEGDVTFETIPLIIDKTDFTSAESKERTIHKITRFIKSQFPKANLAKIDPIGFGHTSETEREVVAFGKGSREKYAETRVFKKTRGGGFLRAFTIKFKDLLGPSRDEEQQQLTEANQEVKADKQELAEAERQLKEAERLASIQQTATNEVNTLRNRIERAQASIDALEGEQGQGSNLGPN